MRLLSEIIDIVDKRSTDETTSPPHMIGSKFQRDRIKHVCEATLKLFEGDILEIGCHVGNTTIILCELARKYKRRVLAVDPWDGNQQGDENVYRQFTKKTEEYSDVLSVYRYRSQDNVIHDLINNSNICFSFIDGLHTYDACKADIELCKNNSGIMCVDDLSWAKELRYLFEERSFEKYYNPTCREGYFVVP
jgi:hypothetical protein